MSVLRLRCTCGRNLADVTHEKYNPTWTRDSLTVSPRPNVDQRDYRPWHAANMAASQAAARARGLPEPGALERLREAARRRLAGEVDEIDEAATPDEPWVWPEPEPERPEVDPEVIAAARAAANPGRVENEDFDWHDRTYVWRCRCGQSHERRHERISGAWAEHMLGDRRVVVLTIGRDL